MATSRDQVAAVLREVFPLRERTFSYELADTEQPMTADGRITVRLMVWDELDGKMSIRDVKEQELFVFDLAMLEGDTPILELLRGWAEALREVFAKADPKKIEWCMPHDLGPGDAIRLRRATTAAEYRDALLKKSRLGKFLR